MGMGWRRPRRDPSSRAMIVRVAILAGVFAATFALAFAVVRGVTSDHDPTPSTAASAPGGPRPLASGVADGASPVASDQTGADDGALTGPGSPPPTPDRVATVKTIAPSPGGNPTASNATAKPAGLRIVKDLIPFTAQRRREMAAYSKRHYGVASIRLKPRVIVLHYTAGGTAAGAHAFFANDQPNLGELPGAVAHFVVDKDGTVYQELPLAYRGRHTVGLNHVAIGIEFVQDALGVHRSERAILARTAQARGGARLVAWLQRTYGIADRDVIGHAMANGSRFFKDLRGWRNDHVDWQAAEVMRFRRLVGKYK